MGLHELTISLSEREMEAVRQRAANSDLTPEQVVMLWMRYGQSVETAAKGRRLFAEDEELFPPGCCSLAE